MNHDNDTLALAQAPAFDPHKAPSPSPPRPLDSPDAAGRGGRLRALDQIDVAAGLGSRCHLRPL
jgi:hypothetical protein